MADVNCVLRSSRDAVCINFDPDPGGLHRRAWATGKPLRRALETFISRPALPELMEIQLLTLACIFVFAFFKFLWSIRLFNNVLVLIGAAPQPGQCDEVIKREYPRQTTLVIGRAAMNFNGGSRTYYFGLDLLPWFVHPYLLIVSTVIVILVLYRRDFRSVTLQLLDDLRAHH
ncbi:MAG: DUF599 domain-containing protein [Proteobacteria bacterium]|nr:DUF599 domain-containing protein [Pseudomonadota bacterium]